MLILKRKICKCGKKALPNRRVCYFCELAKRKANRMASVARQNARRATKKAKVANSFKVLHKKAWEVFSRYIRMKGMDDNEMNVCYTCGKVKHYKLLYAGHLWHGKLDFDERNIHPQCWHCNYPNHGMREAYSANLLSEGIDLIKLRRDAEAKFYTCEELKNIIKKYEHNPI
jgi:hypothetical protein